MKSLKFMRLSSLEKDSFIKIIYGKNRKFSGRVTENDRKKSLEIINSQGEFLVIEYSRIKSFIIKNNISEYVPVQDIQKNTSWNDTEPDIKSDTDTQSAPETEEKIIYEIPESVEFFQNNNYIHTPEINHDYIVNLYKRIDDKDIKDVVTRYFNSFMAGDKNNDNNKCIEAVSGFRRAFQEYSKDSNAVKLLAFMYVYIKDFRNASDVFEDSLDYFNSALYSYLSGNYESAVINAYNFVKNQSGCVINEKILYILILSSFMTGNAFYISDLIQSHSELENGLDYLLYKKDAFLHEDIDLKIERLGEYYNMQKYHSDVDIENFPKNVIFGYVFSVDGLMCSVCPFSNPKKKYFFDRSKIEKKELSEKLSDKEQNVTLIDTAFTSSDGKNVLSIREISVNPKIMANLGMKYYESKNYKPALDCFFYAFSHNEQKENMFFNIVDCYISLADIECKYCKDAKKFIDKNNCEISDKYRINELYLNIFLKIKDSANIKKYLEILIDSAENIDKKLCYLRQKADIFFEEDLYPETIKTLYEWLECFHNSGIKEENYDKDEKDIILPLVERCNLLIAQENSKSVSEAKPDDEIHETESDEIISETVEMESVTEPVPEMEVKESVPESVNENEVQSNEKFPVIFPDEKGILHKPLKQIKYSVLPYPEREKYVSKDFTSRFQKLCRDKKKDTVFVGLFIFNIMKLGFLSVSILKNLLAPELEERKEENYDSFNFMLEFFYSSGIIEKIVTEPEDGEEYYFITENGAKFFNKDIVKKLLGIRHKKNLKIFPFCKDNISETSICINQYDIMLKAISPYSDKYSFEISRCRSEYFKASMVFLKSRRSTSYNKKPVKNIPFSKAAECGFTIITPDIGENFDENSYRLSVKYIIESLKVQIENNLKSVSKYAIIVLSPSYSRQWTEILCEAFSGFLTKENFYMSSENGKYLDICGNSFTADEIICRMLSESPEVPDPSDVIVINEEVSENEQYCEFMNDTSGTSVTPEQIKIEVSKMLKSGKYYCALTYLNAVSEINQDYKSFYNLLSMALDNPSEQCRYTSSEIFGIPKISLYDDSEIHKYCMLCCKLRAVYYNDSSYDYSINSFAEDIKNSPAAEEYPELKTLTDIFIGFRLKFNMGIDCFSDYCMRDKLCAESGMKRLQNQAEELYKRYCNSTEQTQPFRIKVYTFTMFSDRQELMIMLKTVCDSDSDKCCNVENFLLENFIKDKGSIIPSDISEEKIENYIEKIWDKSGERMKSHGKAVGLSCELSSKVRSHSASALRKISSLLCEWTEAVRKGNEFSSYDEALESYKQKRGDILGILNELIMSSDNSDTACSSVLNRTLRDICGRIDGSYNDSMRKYYFIDFLKNSFITLDENGTPDLSSTFYSVPGFSITARIIKHASEPERPFEERLEEIFSKNTGNNDYGSAVIISRYLDSRKIPETLNGYIDNLSVFCDFSEKQISHMREDFIADMELASKQGQLIRNEGLKELFKTILDVWFIKCSDTHNYGFYAKLTDSLRSMIHSESEKLKPFFKSRLDELKKFYVISDSDYEKINSAVESLDYTTAQDYMNLAVKSQIISIDNIPTVRYINDFWKQYSDNYNKCTDEKIYNNSSEFWISGDKNRNEKRIELILEKLLQKKFRIVSKSEKDSVSESFSVFAENSQKKEFDVLCISEYSGDRKLFEYFHRIKDNTLIFLDYAFTESERRYITREIRKDNSLSKEIAVLDRVVITYLEYNYSENNILNMFKSVTMPFSNYQPYKSEENMSAPLTSDDARKLIVTPLSYMGMYFEKPETVSLILADSVYCPSVINFWCRMLVNTLCNDDYAGYDEINSPPYIITETHIKKVLVNENFLNITDDMLKNILISGNNSYYECVLIMAYLYCTADSVCGYTLEEIKATAENNCMKKFSLISDKELLKILDGLCRKGILIKIFENRYLFCRDNFCGIIGSRNEIEDKLLNYMD